MFDLKSAASCLEIWSCLGHGEIGGLQAIRQRKALTLTSDIPSPTCSGLPLSRSWKPIRRGPHLKSHPLLQVFLKQGVVRHMIPSSFVWCQGSPEPKFLKLVKEQNRIIFTSMLNPPDCRRSIGAPGMKGSEVNEESSTA